jgi:hypothetical protein
MQQPQCRVSITDQIKADNNKLTGFIQYIDNNIMKFGDDKKSTE